MMMICLFLLKFCQMNFSCKLALPLSFPLSMQLLILFIVRTKWARLDGVLYKPDGVVLLNVSDDYPTFAQIGTIFVFNNNIFLNVHVMSTCIFSVHYHAFIVDYTTNHKAISVSDLYFPFIFHVRRLIVNGTPKLCIIPRFHIVGTLH